MKRKRNIFLTQFLKSLTRSSLELDDPFDLNELLPSGSTALEDLDFNVRLRDRSNFVPEAMLTATAAAAVEAGFMQ